MAYDIKETQMLLIIVFVGLFALCGLFLGEINLTTLCIGGLVGALQINTNYKPTGVTDDTTTTTTTTETKTEIENDEVINEVA